MKFKINLSKEAESDLENIFIYISDEADSPEIAKKFLSKIDKKINRLKEQPFIHSLCLDSPLYELGFRKLIIGNYIVIYSVDENKNVVNIIRAFHGAQNYIRYF